MGSGSEPTLINSVRRALRLMEAVAQSPTPPNATLLASLTGLAPATAYHLLRTLVAEEYLVQTPDHGYALSDRIAEISRQGQPGARQAKIQRALAALRDRANRAVYLAIFEDGSVRLAAVSENHRNRAIDQWISFDEVPHATALGKATLWVMN
ncbi:MAG: helix-turn-helix domain-containing protein, partial [Acidimicrobiia bacterium]